MRVRLRGWIGIALLPIGIALFFCALVSSAEAQTWNGGSSTKNTWSTAANWTSAPLNNGTAALIFAGSTRLTPDMDAAWSINSLAFSSGAGAFTLASTGNFTLTIQGGGIANNGTAGQTINNAIALGAAQSWNAVSGNLSFGGTIANGGFLLTITGGSNTTATGIISGTGGLTKTGTGTLTLSGLNSYTGATNINVGTLKEGAANVIADSSAVTVASGATYDLNGFSETIGSLAGAGTVTSGAAASITLTSGGTNASTLFSGVVQNGAGTIALAKSGTGTLTLSGANTFTGATTVSTGVLNIQNATALGTVAAGTTVSSGATLQLQGGITVGAEALNIRGVGAAGQTGALVNVSGTNSYGGLLTLAAATTLSSDSGRLDLTNTGTITGATFGLTLTGSGNGSIASIIGTTSGTLTKSGSGTWTLTGADTYTGTTSISAGVLNIQNAAALGTTASGTTVTGGAALQVQGGIAVGGEGLTLNGNGIANDGALRNVSGNNSWSGGVTLASSSIIASDAGTLTLSGGVTTAGFTLTVTGAGDVAQSGVIGGAGGLIKSGAGNLTLTGTNTFTGATLISAGTLTASGAGASLGTTSTITVNSGGTLLLGASDQLKDTAAVILVGGTFAKGNFSEGTTSTVGVGALTLTATGSHIDFGTGTVGTLTFASFISNSNTITIDNWTGVLNTQGTASTDRLIFNSDQSGNLAFFQFVGFAAGATEFAVTGSPGYFEVVPLAPVPEPRTYAIGLLGLLLLSAHSITRHRRRSRPVAKRQKGVGAGPAGASSLGSVGSM